MTSIHDQAMNYVYQQVLQRLLGFFSRAERTALQLLIQRLVVAAGGMERIADFKVLVIQSGTLDSCYTLALLRAAQLSIAGRAPGTFQLRVATLRLNGTGPMALDNIHRSNSALFLYDDPRVELLMVDNREVMPFNHLQAIGEGAHAANRLNMLMLAHRRTWTEPLDLSDDGYLSTGEFYGQIARWDGGVNALINSDSPRQQKQFINGLSRAARRADLGMVNFTSSEIDRLFALLDNLGSDYYQAFYVNQEQAPWRPLDSFEACRRSTCIDIHDLLVAKLEERWPLLTDFLGVRSDELATHLSIQEFICPMIAAHVRGLAACFVAGNNYEAGQSEYIRRALVLMRRKHVPERLCEQAEALFADSAVMAEQRIQAAADAQKTLGLSEAQLICLLFAPFVDQGAGLERFLRRCHPGMLVAMPDLHRAMQGHPVPEQVLQWMIDVSGLPVSLIGTLYGMTSPDVDNREFGLPLDDADGSPQRDSGIIGELSAGR
ncbi:hypothetical protein NYP20_15320 [Pseudomonas sp. N3-W]|uniref:hypothetical protein n=1 Tax=Pseudomonas sp. N3-W TaxID=2975049 RepID=UPI00217DE725|nr:hypothetical protein [Pseudomonas sp. N3-W]UWF46723.1 hypothetical protein NYP20_15320 [Pseudomonas sp. N3-W]